MPHAIAIPELPSRALSSVPARPRSSSDDDNVSVLPATLRGPVRDIKLSTILILATPSSPAFILPKSPK